MDEEIPFDELLAFLTIAELGSFTRASRRLGRTQPAISRRIHQLEERVGTTLFDRAGRRVGLSEAGEILLPHAERAIAAVRDGVRAVRERREPGPTTLKLAIVGTLADSHLVDALRAFEEQHGERRVEIATSTSREVSALVKRGDAHLGLRYFSDPDAALASRRLGEERLVLIVSAGHRLRQSRLRKLEKLAGERWLGFPPEPGQVESFGHLLQRLLAAEGLAPSSVTVIDSLTAQKRLVEAGHGIALMPRSSVREELRLGSLRAIELPGQTLALPIVAVTRPEGFESPLASAFLELLGPLEHLG